MIEEFFKYLAEHTEDLGSWSIEFNDHKSVYETASQVLARFDEHSDVGPFFGFESPEMKQKCIDTNTIYSLQWYNLTPVGFVTYAAPSLQDLAAWVLKDKPTG